MIEAQNRVPFGSPERTYRRRRVVPLLLALTDVGTVYLAFIAAYWVRYSLELGPAIQDRVSFDAYQPLAIVLLGVMIPVLAVKGAYRTRMGTEVVDELAAIFSTATITVASVVVVSFMAQKFAYSRGVIIYLWISLIVLVFLARVLFRAVQSWCYRRGWGAVQVVVVGATDAGKMAMQRMMSRPDLGYHLSGFVDHRGSPQVRNFGRFRALGTIDDLPELIESGEADEIIVALPSSAHEEMWSILTLCEKHGVDLKIIPDLFELNLSKVQVDDIAGIPLLNVGEPPLRRIAWVAKRIVDLVLGTLLFVVTLPLLAILSVLIRIETPGAALLRQQRIGLGGRPFTCYKLRTMHDGAEELLDGLQDLNEMDGPIFKIRNDPRCTRLGRLMRRWSLDELPNLLNVLKGDMSIVGPRPPLPTEVAKYEPIHMRRLEVKPGMTGVWQVSGRSNLPFDEMFYMDLYYVENWSLARDAAIMLRTVLAVLSRHGAY